MGRRGSVLIVVLGLLAILAVVGITFVTMSSIDRSAASSFAMNTQMILAADGAVDYVAATLVNDVWYTKYLTLAYSLMPPTQDAPPAYDCPGPTTAYDPWLSDPIVDPAASTALMNMSFGATSKTATAYGITNFGTNYTHWPDDSTIDLKGPNNLAFPTPAVTIPANGYGVWIPELSFPYEQYLVRVSLTILDHGALLNLNAHGNLGAADAPGWTPYNASRGHGYYISDINPVFPPDSTTLRNLLISPASGLPGRWGGSSGALPTVPETGETMPENAAPTGSGLTPNYPLTLDEEVRLRLMGRSQNTTLLPVTTSSRLDGMFPGKMEEAGTPQSQFKRHLAWTTVGWTAEVTGDASTTHLTNAPTGRIGKLPDGSAPPTSYWSAPKADINRDAPVLIYDALCSRAFTASDGTGVGATHFAQLVANLTSFRSGSKPPRAPVSFPVVTFSPSKNSPKISGAPSDTYVGADRQPLFSAYRIVGKLVQDPNFPNDATKQVPQYTLTVEVYNPWPGVDAFTPTGGLPTPNMQVVFGTKGGAPFSLPATMTYQQCVTATPVGGLILTGTLSTDTFTTIIGTITPLPSTTGLSGCIQLQLKRGDLPGTGYIVLDDIDTTELVTRAKVALNVTTKTCDITCIRPMRMETEERCGGALSCQTPVFYLGDWVGTLTAPALRTWGQPVPAATNAQLTWIPIRFPKCIDSSVDGGTGATAGHLTDFYTQEAGATFTGILPPVQPCTFTTGTTRSFKAFPRLGDLNQVLSRCGSDGGSDPTVEVNFWFWPWTNKVGRATLIAAGADGEALVKFNWKPQVASFTVGGTDPSLAANVLCVGGPWNDGKDNDGDGYTDSPYWDVLHDWPAGTGSNFDCGCKTWTKSGATLNNPGRFGGPELRVNGKINLNTATDYTLANMESSLNMPSPGGLRDITSTPANPKPLWKMGATPQPLQTPAKILKVFAGSKIVPAKVTTLPINAGTLLTPDVSKGYIEDRDWWFTAISNVATVRSDTFSVYGTVEVVEPVVPPGGNTVTLRGVRARHFWALIDRSPSLAFPPSDTNFVHPRVLNFQWID